MAAGWNRRAAAQLGLLLTSVAALALRAPDLLRWPRFHAEEGRRYFSYAFEHGWFDTLSFVYFRAAYLNLTTNVAVAAATLVPLEFAPLVTTAFALAVMTIPLLIIAFGTSRVFVGAGKKATGCALIVFAPHLPAEVWLTTLQSQVYLGVVALLILLEDLADAGSFRRWSYRGLLLLAGLSGPYALILQPAFALRAFADHTRENIVHLAILTVTLLIQIAAYIETARVNPLRIRGVDLELVTYISVRQVAWPLLGQEGVERLARAAGPLVEYGFLGGLLVVFLVGQIDWGRRALRRTDERTLLAVAFCLLAAATSALSMGGAGGRYAVVSGFAVLFYALRLVGRSQPRAVSLSMIAILTVSLYAGVGSELVPDAERCNGKVPISWHEEVARWRREPVSAAFWKREIDDVVHICPVAARRVGGPKASWDMRLKRER